MNPLWRLKDLAGHSFDTNRVEKGGYRQKLKRKSVAKFYLIFDSPRRCCNASYRTGCFKPISRVEIIHCSWIDLIALPIECRFGLRFWYDVDALWCIRRSEVYNTL